MWLITCIVGYQSGWIYGNSAKVFPFGFITSDPFIFSSYKKAFFFKAFYSNSYFVPHLLLLVFAIFQDRPLIFQYI